ncbi:hypothetical protein BDR06DRAFT_948682 [Suillus hirtellus]|nr:hypothetical protein BDR06DRAFT_948682 [Suillus hirtellus]
MAQGGFVYTPQTKGDDTVTCLYCNLSLGGWDADDDPMWVNEALPLRRKMTHSRQRGT